MNKWFSIMRYTSPMRLNITPNKVNIEKQRGSSLVIAIFILVVMSALGASMVNMLRSNEQTHAYEVLGTRAYAAAQSGVQWQLQQLFPLSATTNTGLCTDTTLEFNSHEGLNNCKAKVICTVKHHDESNVDYFTIISQGQCDINGEQTSRDIEVRAKSTE